MSRLVIEVENSTKENQKLKNRETQLRAEIENFAKEKKACEKLVSDLLKKNEASLERTKAVETQLTVEVENFTKEKKAC